MDKSVFMRVWFFGLLSYLKTLFYDLFRYNRIPKIEETSKYFLLQKLF